MNLKLRCRESELPFGPSMSIDLCCVVLRDVDDENDWIPEMWKTQVIARLHNNHLSFTNTIINLRSTSATNLFLNKNMANLIRSSIISVKGNSYVNQASSSSILLSKPKLDHVGFCSMPDLNRPNYARSLACNSSRGSQATQAVVTNRPNNKLEEEIVIDNSEDTWQVKMLYDGECPLCMIEVNALRDRNKSYGTIKFVDISSSDYSPEENAGVEFETAMGKIHCIQRDGQVFTGISAFQKFYDVLGMGWVYSLTNIKPIGNLADAVYDFWAKYRLPITGRPPLAVVLEERRLKKEAADSCGVDGRCHVDF